MRHALAHDGANGSTHQLIRASRNTPAAPSVHRRNQSLWPVILGGTSYMVFPSGARILGERPIITYADVELSAAPDFYEGLTTVCPRKKPGPKTCSNRCRATNSKGVTTTHRLGAPHPQFGPSRWFAWPERNLGGGTHQNRMRRLGEYGW